MADEKKNPLIGAFRSPEPPKTPTEPKPAQPPGAAPAVQPKAEETPKLTEPGKPIADPKTPPTSTTTPAKADETKKPVEPGKPTTDPKAPLASGTTTPAKADETKKPDEPGKPTTDPKASADSKTASNITPSKSGDSKKPANQPTSEDVVDGDIKKEMIHDVNTQRVDTDGKLVVPSDEAQALRDAATAKADKADDDIPKDFKFNIVPESDLGKVVLLPINLIDDFEGHPFPVVDDKEMWDLVASIKQFGVLENATVIPNEKTPGRYEMVAGHRRKRGSQLAGLTHIPAIVRNMDHDTAVIFMVDSNLKRENISPMVKARAYNMKLEAMKRKSGRRSKADILTGEKPKQAVEELAAQTGESATTIKKIRNLVNLNPVLQEMVDKNKIPVTAASDIASLKKEEQAVLADAMQREDKVPSITQAAELKAASKDGTLTKEKIEAVVAPTKREENPPLKVVLNEDELRPYFPDKRTTVPDAKRVVLDALSLRQKALENKAKQAAQGAPDKKKSALAR